MGQIIDSSVLVSFYMYISRFFNPIQTLAEQFDMLQRSFASAEKIFTILDMVPEVVDEPDAIELEEIRGEIEFRDVSFKYPRSEEWVLRHVNMKFKVGKRMAIVGENGSGKTTLLSIIAGFHAKTSGKVEVFGEGYTNENILNHRSKIGWVSSSFFDKYLKHY